MHTKTSPYAPLWLNWLVHFDNLLIAVMHDKTIHFNSFIYNGGTIFEHDFDHVSKNTFMII